MMKVFWADEYLMIIGDHLNTSSHQHQGIQIAMALEGSIEVITVDGPFQGELLILDSNYLHRMAGEGISVMILIEQESDVGKLLMTQLEGQSCIAIQDALEVQEALKKLMCDTASLIEANHIWDLLYARFSVSRPQLMDERIVESIAYMKKHLNENLSAEILSERLYLSVSRFQHLFRDQTGVSLRRYLLWIRLKNALIAISDGQSFTNAAHRAGFTDGAHFSRTMKKTFGVVLRDLLKDSSGVQVITT